MTQAKQNRTQDPSERFDVGLIGAPHGVCGEVRVKVLSDVPGRIKYLKEAFLISKDRRTERSVRVRTRPGKGGWLVAIEGIRDREAAAALNGCYLSISRQQAGPLPQGRFFVRDLIGLEVRDERLGSVGFLKDVLKDSVQDIYVVRRDGGKDFLFPAVPQFLKKISLSEGVIFVALPDGLLEVYD
jgi:16S rRNA processing protein RimM